MSQQIGKLQTLTGGISTISKKLGPPNSFAWARSLDFRSDPAQQTTYPQTRKISGSIVTDLPMFGDVAGEKLYFHGNTGSIYSVDTNDAVTKEYTVPNSTGNGIVYFAETGQLYIPTNTSITRRNTAIGNGNYFDNFLETSGGAPTNIKALLLRSASSQSATRASTASLQLAGDMTLEAYLKPTTLPGGAATNKRGVSLSGLEFGSNIPGALNIDYFESSQNTFTYFGDKGFKTVRLPFSWERLQPTLGGSLDATYKNYIDTQIQYAANAGMQVILDCHNFGRRKEYLDGGITENFTAQYPALLFPWADYNQAGNIVLRDYGQSFFGTVTNPVSPATSYAITWTMQFNSRDTSFGGEGLYVRPFYTDASNYYEFQVLNDGTNTWLLKKVVSGSSTTLKSGTFGFVWGTNVSHTFKIDVGQATSGKINILLDGVALYTNNTASTDVGLTGGKVGFYAPGVHVQLSTMILNVAGDTTSGGIVTLRVGDPELTTANFASLWDKISTAYAANTTVLGYDLMNEPHDMPLPTFSGNYKSTAYNTGLSGLTYRSIDAMKYSKDNVTNQMSVAAITSYVKFLAAKFNLTHIGISVPLDSNADFVANGSTPSPLTVEGYLAAWCTAIHDAGLKVLYRGTFCNMENIYNFPFKPNGLIPMGTTSSASTDGNTTWLGKLYSRIQTIGSNFESGDIFAPFPEQTSYVFNGNSFLPTSGGIQTNYYTFFESVHTVISAAFTNLSISGVVANLTTNNYSELASGYLNSSFITTIGAQAVDYYGNYNGDGYTPAQFASDLSTIYTSHGNTAVFLQEWADLNNVAVDEATRITYLNSFYAALAGLGSKLNGFNYWGGWATTFSDSSTHFEGILTNSGTDANPVWSLNYNGQILQSFFASSGNALSTVSAMEQAAITAIRVNDSNHYILAELDHWAGGQNFTTDYGSNPDPWLTDSGNKLIYSFHYYFDNDHSGSYQQAFADSNNTNITSDVSPLMQWSRNHDLTLHCGEYGVPNQSDWLICLTTFLNLCNQYNVWANHWSAGDAYSAITTLQPIGSSPSYTDQLQMSIVGQAKFLSGNTASSSDKMTIISKWDESGSKLGYKLDIVPTSAAFGDGSDSALTISGNQTETVIDANCSGTQGTSTLNIENITGNFSVGQKVYIHQTRGTNHGTKQVTTIIGGDLVTNLVLADNLTFSPTHSSSNSVAEKAQIRVVKQYTDVTINAGVTLTTKAWNGLKGGLGFIDNMNGTLTVNGSISGTGKGFRGGTGQTTMMGNQGEGYAGIGTTSLEPNGNGAGAGTNFENAAGAEGGGFTAGANGQFNPGTVTHAPLGGLSSGSSDGTLIDLGGGGSSCGIGGGFSPAVGPTGGNGGAIIEFWAANLVLGGSGSIVSNGSPGTASHETASGAGAPGPIIIHCQTATIGTNQITATPASAVSGTQKAGGGGSAFGLIVGDCSTPITGTTNPTSNSIQDDNLSLANGYALRLYISDDGSGFETYTQQINDFTGAYKFYSVSWQAATSTARFYENGQLIGTKVGARTSINQNAAIFGIGCYVNSSSAKTGFYDGLIDDVRIWSTVRTQAQISAYYGQILSGSELGLIAYYPMDGAVTDAQSGGLNNLTANNSPTYSPDVAFKGVTNRGDEDVFANHTGQLYTLKAAISETSTDKITFVPTKEPFKSLALDIDTIGTGNWTVTVHDELNDVVATITVANADLLTGVYEFRFASSERIVLNATYHIHVYSTVNDGKVVTGTASDLSTAYLKTYFQILVNDIYHQAVQFQNFVAIANERYLAVLQAGNVYNPHRLIFPSGYRLRSIAFWQQYIVLGMWFGNNITDTDTGKAFFWDGESDTYIDELDIPQGGVNAMIGTQGGLLVSAGYKGAMLEYTGYPSSFRYTARTSAQLAFRLPNVSRGDTVEIAPGALTMWNSMNRIGVSFNSNSSTIHNGIYTYGQYTDGDPMSVGFDYPLSIGDNTNSLVKIGCLFTRGAKLYAGFQNSNTFGIDVVDENADPYPTGTLEYLITDLGSVAAKKLPLTFRRDFEPLTEGQSVSLKWKPDRASNWIPLKTQDNVGATDVRAPIDQRIKEAQYAVDWVNTSQSVVFTQTTIESDDESDSLQA